MRGGITVTTFASFNEAEESKVVRIAPASIAKAAIEMGNSGECEAVFLSCTNLRTLDIIDDVEAAIDLPVLSSNQVLGWDILCKTGGSSDGFRPGRLWG
jgi:maleate isomerase